MKEPKLRVRKPSSAPRRHVTESQFESKIAKILSEMGVFSYHVSEKAYMGIPDRYVQGGRWIEFKQAAIRQHITPNRFLTPSQKQFMDSFLNCGDQPFLCMLIQFRIEYPVAILEPWELMKEDGQRRWSYDEVKQRGFAQEDWETMVRDKIAR